MNGTRKGLLMGRREFLGAAAAGSMARATIATDPQAETPVAWERVRFSRRDLPLKARPFPMSLYVESMPDDASIAAVLYGPMVLAGEMGRTDPVKEPMFEPMGPLVKTNEIPFPVLRADPAKPESWLKPAAHRAGTFQTAGQEKVFTLAPLYRILDQRYTVYWKFQPTS